MREGGSGSLPTRRRPIFSVHVSDAIATGGRAVTIAIRERCSRTSANATPDGANRHHGVHHQDPPRHQQRTARPPSKPTGHPTSALPGHRRDPRAIRQAHCLVTVETAGHPPSALRAVVETHRAIRQAHCVAVVETHRAIRPAHCEAPTYDWLAVETHRAIRQARCYLVAVRRPRAATNRRPPHAPPKRRPR